MDSCVSEVITKAKRLENELTKKEPASAEAEDIEISRMTESVARTQQDVEFLVQKIQKEAQGLSETSIQLKDGS